jgi:hypothetical protein
MMDSRASSLVATVCSAWFALVCGCSLVDPRVGAVQASSCAAGEQGSSGYGGGSGSGSGADGGLSCGTDSGSACDDCESLHCCDTRLACYGDRVCGCADQALDQCLEMASADGDADASDAIARCWDAFTTTGHVALARVSCQRTWCQAACAVP